MQRFIDFTLPIIEEQQQCACPDIDKPNLTNTQYPTKHSNDLFRPNRHTGDGELLRLYKAMDLAG